VQSTRCGDIKHITRPNGPEEVSSWLGDGSAILTVIACRLICGPYLQVSKTWIICWSSATLFWPKVSSIPNNCRELLVRNCHRDLGLLVTSNLHWNEHYDMLLKKAYKTLGLIRRIFQNARVVQTKKTSIPNTCSFQTAILLPHLASPVHEWHQEYWEHSETCYKIHFEWLFLWL